MEKVRELVFYRKYASDFIQEQPDNVQKKIFHVLNIVRTHDPIPTMFFKHIEAGLYEIRIEFQSNIYRIFCCFDSGWLVILFNGFQKKTRKTPTNEIERAKRIMSMYIEERRNENGNNIIR